jgi:hypothetical protein
MAPAPNLVGMPRSAAYEIELGGDERAELEHRVACYTLSFRQVRRARLVLYAAEGHTNREIAQAVRAARDSNPNHQIRRLALSVHPVFLSAVCAAQVGGRVQPVPENPSGAAWWTATRTPATLSGKRRLRDHARRRPGRLQTDRACSRWMPHRSRRILWMIIGRIKAHPTQNRMACRSPVVLCSGL